MCADIVGFSLQAAVRVEAHGRKRLDQLCRCITCPARTDERLQFNAAGQLKLKLKALWCDGTAHLVMSPPEFMQRLAAPVVDTRNRARDARASDRFAAANSGGRMPSLGQQYQFAAFECSRSPSAFSARPRTQGCHALEASCERQVSR